MLEGTRVCGLTCGSRGKNAATEHFKRSNGARVLMFFWKNRKTRKAEPAAPALAAPTEPESRAIGVLRDAVKGLGRNALQETATSPAECEWLRFRQRLQNSIAGADPRAFLRWAEIRHTMFVDDQAYVANELEALQASKRWDSHWRHALAEDAIGCPPRYAGYPASSGNLIHHAYHLERFVVETDCLPWQLERVFELGGGYGSMARLLLRLGFCGTYTILDFPEFCALQRYFLGATGLNTSGLSWVDAPEDIPALTGDSSLLMATWSLSECPLDFRERVLKAAGVPSHYLIGYQSRFGEVDNGAFFRTMARQYGQVRWAASEISHLPGNYYMFGRATSHLSPKPVNEP